MDLLWGFASFSAKQFLVSSFGWSEPRKWSSSARASESFLSLPSPNVQGYIWLVGWKTKSHLFIFYLSFISLFFKKAFYFYWGSSAGKESTCNARDLGLIPGLGIDTLGSIPWKRERLTTPVFWPGEFPELHSPWGCKKSD